MVYNAQLLIAHKPHSLQPTQLGLASIAYSYAQRRVVAESDCVCVWYDYDKWEKTIAPESLATAVKRRVR